MEILDIVRIGQRQVAHPHPDPLVAFDHGIGPHAAVRRHRRLSGHPHAARRVVGGVAGSEDEDGAIDGSLFGCHRRGGRLQSSEAGILGPDAYHSSHKTWQNLEYRSRFAL
ncbi:MAG: hypothetical protein VYA17_13390 [Pseudomonadota bacterium]|nr:hypothetical protein [Pseudomonadota bacterium]